MEVSRTLVETGRSPGHRPARRRRPQRGRAGAGCGSSSSPRPGPQRAAGEPLAAAGCTAGCCPRRRRRCCSRCSTARWGPGCRCRAAVRAGRLGARRQLMLTPAPRSQHGADRAGRAAPGRRFALTVSPLGGPSDPRLAAARTRRSGRAQWGRLEVPVTAFAAEVPDVELADYQRAVRTVLRHPLISERYPDREGAAAGPPVVGAAAHGPGRRPSATGWSCRPPRPGWSAPSTTSTPASRARTRSRAGVRPAPLRLPGAGAWPRSGRAGIQVALSELADTVAADAQPDRRAGPGHRPGRRPGGVRRRRRPGWRNAGRSGWPTGRPAAWADDPGRSEALYDIDRDVALRRLPADPGAAPRRRRSPGLLYAARRRGRDSGRREAGQRGPAGAGRAAGRLLRRGRRRRCATCCAPRGSPPTSPGSPGWRSSGEPKGWRCMDTAGLAERRFPAGGTVAQAALLLARRDRRPGRRPGRAAAGADAGRPAASERARRHWPRRSTPGCPTAEVWCELADRRPGRRPDERRAVDAEPAQYPLSSDGWLAATMDELVGRYATTFGAEWRADPPRLLRRGARPARRAPARRAGRGRGARPAAGGPLPQRHGPRFEAPRPAPCSNSGSLMTP